MKHFRVKTLIEVRNETLRLLISNIFMNVTSDVFDK